MRSEKTRGAGMFILFLISGALLGGILGELIAETPALSGIAPYLVKKHHIFDMAPASINLFVVQLKAGITLQPNLISIIGMICAIVIFKKF